MTAVDMRIELDALFRYLAQLCQRKDLEAAAVGEDRFFSGHELMQAAHVLHKTVARSDMQMIGV